jgi:hypothetical protein
VAKFFKTGWNPEEEKMQITTAPEGAPENRRFLLSLRVSQGALYLNHEEILHLHRVLSDLLGKMSEIE